ncbi:hypothetical protein V6N13_004643 [Hibiscus sabdariffa]|uniref:Uncharacterized protein n=1 Tax=Hibiscus sabdariffa TaxID=183260 RepID=A0ABR2RZP0_9ROSI
MWLTSASKFYILKDPAEASARHHVATDGQNPWVESPQKETQDAVTTERVQAPQDKFATSTEPAQLPDQPLTLIHDTSVSSRNQKSQDDSSVIGAVGIEDKIVPMEDEANHVKTEKSDVPSVFCPEQNKIHEYESKVASNELAEKGGSQAKPGEKDPTAAENSELSVNHLSFIPKFAASATKVALEDVEEVKAKGEGFTSIKRDAIEKGILIMTTKPWPKLSQQRPRKKLLQEGSVVQSRELKRPLLQEGLLKENNVNSPTLIPTLIFKLDNLYH